MRNGFIIYDLQTGDVSMMLRTDDPTLLLLNTPDGHSAVMSKIEDIKKVKKINVITNSAELVSETSTES